MLHITVMNFSLCVYVCSRRMVDVSCSRTTIWQQYRWVNADASLPIGTYEQNLNVHLFPLFEWNDMFPLNQGENLHVRGCDVAIDLEL